MIVTIATSGGIGGFGLGKTSRVEVEALPVTMQQTVCDTMTTDRLGALAAQAPGKGADRLVYEIAIEGDDGSVARFDIPETAMPDEMRDLIDSMREFGK